MNFANFNMGPFWPWIAVAWRRFRLPRLRTSEFSALDQKWSQPFACFLSIHLRESPPSEHGAQAAVGAYLDLARKGGVYLLPRPILFCWPGYHSRVRLPAQIPLRSSGHQEEMEPDDRFSSMRYPKFCGYIRTNPGASAVPKDTCSSVLSAMVGDICDIINSRKVTY